MYITVNQLVEKINNCEHFTIDELKMDPGMYRYDIVWKKQKPSNFQLMNFQMGRVTENICVFSKAKSCYTKTALR